MAEASNVLKDLMVNAIYGEAGEKVVIEEFLSGVEASYLAFTDGKSILPLSVAQDHKPLLDDDKGPNTGGMGAYTPIPFISKPIRRRDQRDCHAENDCRYARKGHHIQGCSLRGIDAIK